MKQYDTNAEALCDIFRCMNVVSVTGADELQGIVLADSIGHVQADDNSERNVFDAYHTWLTICTWKPSVASNQPETQTPETPLQAAFNSPMGIDNDRIDHFGDDDSDAEDWNESNEFHDIPTQEKDEEQEALDKIARIFAERDQVTAGQLTESYSLIVS